MKHTAHNNFDLLRLILATLVVLGHVKTLPIPASAPGFFAYAEVNAFFVISGYLIFDSFDKKPVIGSFYIRRLFRIYPLYAATVLVQGLLMVVLIGDIFGHMGELLRYLAFNLVFANFLAYDIGGVLGGLYHPGINPSLWTLKIEVGFYFILPLLWVCIRRWGAAFLILLYVASVAYATIALHNGADILARQLPGQLRFFAAGMALCHYRHKVTLPALWLICLAFLLMGLSALSPDWLLVPLAPVWLGLLVFVIAMRLRPVVKLPTDISYGVYLFHGPLIQFALLRGIFHDTPEFLLLLTGIVYLLAFIAERLVEQPGIDLGKRLARAWDKRHAERAS